MKKIICVLIIFFIGAVWFAFFSVPVALAGGGGGPAGHCSTTPINGYYASGSCTITHKSPGACHTKTTTKPGYGSPFYDLGYNPQPCQPYGSPTQPYGFSCYHPPVITTHTVCDPPIYTYTPGNLYYPCSIPFVFPQIVQPDWCNAQFRYTLSWTALTCAQTAKQIQISNDNNFNSIIYNSGMLSDNINSFTLPATGTNLQYNKTYYFRVKLWNIRGESNWSTAQTIATPKNAYPTPDFISDSNNPTQFTDASIGTNINEWLWTFQDGAPATSTVQNPLISFATAGQKNITLDVKDANGYSCPIIQKTLTVPSPSPSPSPSSPTPTPGSPVSPTPTPDSEPDIPPQVSSLNISPQTCTNDCKSCLSPLTPTLSWTVDSRIEQKAFQLEVSDKANFSNIVSKSEKITSAQKVCMVPDQCKLNNSLAYGDKYYYFRVRIWNSRDEASPWKEGSSFFKTPVHEYPSPNFSWDPTKPRINEDVQFTDLSRAYGDGNAIVSWFWTIPDSDATEEDLITNNPMVKFTNISGTRSVKLRIQDQDGLYCEESKDIQTQGKLPKWREILPW